MVVIGVAVGFRVQMGLLPFLGGMLLVLLFAYSMSWPSPRRPAGRRPGDGAGGGLPGDGAAGVRLLGVRAGELDAELVRQGFANHQPVSVTASAVRALVLGGLTASDVWQSLAWAAGIVAVFAPLAVWRYRRV